MKLFGFWRSMAAFRVRIALNLKGIKLDEPETSIDLMAGKQFDPAYKAVNPQMVLPALVDGSGPVLFQSLAIIEYLDETHPQPPLLPGDPRGRARVRGLAQIVSSDSHPLIVPRVRTYLQKELKLDDAGVLKWVQHFQSSALSALESHLAGESDTGRYSHGDKVTMADLCVVQQVVASRLFKVDMAPFPTCVRVADECLKIDAFARAHPLKQPGAPSEVTH
jgi:maleylacetoacetate isomerase